MQRTDQQAASTTGEQPPFVFPPSPLQWGSAFNVAPEGGREKPRSILQSAVSDSSHLVRLLMVIYHWPETGAALCSTPATWNTHHGFFYFLLFLFLSTNTLLWIFQQEWPEDKRRIKKNGPTDCQSRLFLFPPAADWRRTNFYEDLEEKTGIFFSELIVILCHRQHDMQRMIPASLLQSSCRRGACGRLEVYWG